MFPQTVYTCKYVAMISKYKIRKRTISSICDKAPRWHRPHPPCKEKGRRRKRNHTWPTSCPPKTFPNFGASGKVIPWNIFAFREPKKTLQKFKPPQHFSNHFSNHGNNLRLEEVQKTKEIKSNHFSNNSQRKGYHIWKIKLTLL